MATRLSIYNGALLLCRDRKLMSLTESGPRRSALDQVWNDGGVDTCLMAGLWNHASRSLQLDFDPDVTPSFGLQNGFSMTSDWKRTLAVCSDEYFNAPLNHYLEEGRFLFADLQTIWVRFVSNDPDYGGDMANWPENFSRYVESYFAKRVVGRIAQSKEIVDDVNLTEKRALNLAKSTDAMEEPTAMLPTGTWANARMSRRSRLDRGLRNNLIGS